MSEPETAPQQGAVQQRPRRDLGGLIIPGVLGLVGVFLVMGILTMKEAGGGGVFGPKAFPWIVAVLCFVVAAAMTAQVLRPPAPAGADPGDEADAILDAGPDDTVSPVAAQPGSNWVSLGTVIGGVVLFILLLEPLGWLVSATLLFAIVAVGLGSRQYVTCLLAGLGMASVMQIVFGGLLGIHIPPGILGG